jgi:broad-specificity NMP kinase
VPIQNFGNASKNGINGCSIITNTAADLARLCSGYPLKKIQENNEAEIMQVVLEEARSSYVPEIVVELSSENLEDLDSNIARILEWITQWTKNQEVD